nr:hypothetical protein [Streptomyces sp. TLI_235]
MVLRYDAVCTEANPRTAVLARAGWDVSSLLPGRHHGPSSAGPTPLNTSVPVQLVIAACV